ncbi:hypothetical protein M2158_000165 [Streptomyces sp. SAI-144]|nr:hypothetical protein [Streptomyces sp. SAI-144]MDH6492954.1 hypothetical protein [Streptomyces sp. SAI-127]
MWEGPFYRVWRDGYEICFVPGADEELDEVCNVDMWVTRDDGERWSGTVFTLDEVHRLMDHHRQTGERCRSSSSFRWVAAPSPTTVGVARGGRRAAPAPGPGTVVDQATAGCGRCVGVASRPVRCRA